MNIIDRIQGPLALVGGIALMVATGLALVAGELSVPARIALAVGILCLGGSIAIDPGRALQAVTRRESVRGSNAMVLTIAVVGILVVGNVLANRFHQRWDLTAQNDFSLSEATLNILGQLPQPVQATGFFSGSLNDKQKAQDLLKEYEARSGGKFTWEMVDTNMDPSRARLEQVNVDGTIKFAMGDRKQDTITPDEAHITTALIKLVNPNPLKVYFTTGHGERQLEQFNDDGYSEFQTQLRADNYVIDTTTLTGPVPQDAAALIIAAPKTPFTEAELNSIKQYLDGKGRLLLLVDPLQDDSNAAEILKRWDLTLGNGVVVGSQVDSLQNSPLTLLPVIRPGGFHAIIRDLGGVRAIMPFSTTIEIPQFIKRGVDVSAIVQTADTRSWLETDRSVIQFDDGADKRGPLTVAVAVEEVENPETLQETPPGFEDPNRRVKNRAVVFGTSEMAINGLIKVPSYANRDILLNSINWITGTDQLITTRPRIEERRNVFLTENESRFIFFSSAIFFPLLLLGAGTVIWWMRR